MLTLKKINEELEALGVAEKLCKGNGYFFFSGGSASLWTRTCVFVPNLNALSLFQWVNEHHRLSQSEGNITWR